MTQNTQPDIEDSKHTIGECTVCCEPLNAVNSRQTVTILFTCGHSIHEKCVNEWFRGARQDTHGRTCPICRKEVVNTVALNRHQPTLESSISVTGRSVTPNDLARERIRELNQKTQQYTQAIKRTAAFQAKLEQFQSDRECLDYIQVKGKVMMGILVAQKHGPSSTINTRVLEALYKNQLKQYEKMTESMATATKEVEKLEQDLRIEEIAVKASRKAVDDLRTELKQRGREVPDADTLVEKGKRVMEKQRLRAKQHRREEKQRLVDNHHHHQQQRRERENDASAGAAPKNTAVTKKRERKLVVMNEEEKKQNEAVKSALLNDFLQGEVTRNSRDPVPSLTQGSNKSSK